MDHPQVTVLMTVYNGLPYLREAVQSVLDQTFVDFELLIVDDCSTDGSVAYVESLHDSRIRLVRNECNQGQALSLNKGLDMCQTPFVARLDQDDVCLPDRLHQQVALLEAKPHIAVVGTFMRGIDVHGKQVSSYRRRLDDYGVFVAFLLLGICPLFHPSVMFRREAMVQVGGYDPSFAPAEDVDLWVRLAMRQYRVHVLSEPLLLYREHSRQQSITKAQIQQENIRRAQKKLITAFCPTDAVRGVSLLLTMDETLWRDYSSQDELSPVLCALKPMFETLCRELAMSPLERTSFKRILNRWLGPGVRWAPRFARLPSWLFYLVLFGFSPLLANRVRPLLSSIGHPTKFIAIHRNA